MKNNAGFPRRVPTSWPLLYWDPRSLAVKSLGFEAEAFIALEHKLFLGDRSAGGLWGFRA